MVAAIVLAAFAASGVQRSGWNAWPEVVAIRRLARFYECPQYPGALDKESVQQATLRRASELAGDAHALGRRLGIGPTSLKAMIEGRVSIPDWIFLRAADLIGDRQRPPGER